MTHEKRPDFAKLNWCTREFRLWVLLSRAGSDPCMGRSAGRVLASHLRGFTRNIIAQPKPWEDFALQSTNGLEWEEFGCNGTRHNRSGQDERVATDISRFR